MQHERTKLVALLVSPAFTSPAAHRAAARVPELRVELPRNQHLSEELWTELYTQKPKVPVKQARQLVSRKLSRTQAEYVLAFESRTKVLGDLVVANTLDLDLQEKVLTSKGFNAGVAALWMKAGTVHPALERRVAILAGGTPLIEWLAQFSVETLPTGEFLEIFSQWSGWLPGTYQPGPLETLASRRPDATEHFIEHRDWTVRKAVASSRHLLTLEQQCRLARLEVGQEPVPLWEYGSQNVQVLYSLIQNPNLHPDLARTIVKVGERLGITSYTLREAQERIEKGYAPITEPWEVLTDPEQLEAVCQYVLGRSYLHRLRQSPANEEALAHNPNLSERWRQEVHSKLAYTRWEEGSPRAKAVEAYRAIHGEDSIRELPPRPEYTPYEAPGSGRPFDPNVPAQQIQGGGRPSIEWMIEALQEDEAAWDVLLTLLDGFEGSVAELADVVLHI